MLKVTPQIVGQYRKPRDELFCLKYHLTVSLASHQASGYSKAGER